VEPVKKGNTMAIDKEAIRAMLRKAAGRVENGPCPVCPGVQLETITIDDTEQDFCPQCNGIFLDKGEAADFGEGLDDFPDFKWSWEHRELSNKKCPRHPEQFMWEVPYHQGENLKVDICQECQGIWLDFSEIGELERIMADVTDPKLRNAKLAAEMERKGLISLT
jgi:Zn-finger nucleic acid-binding protein